MYARPYRHIVWALICSFCSTAFGQAGGDPPDIVGGGAAMADFATLMNLIEQTIEPDSWLANGGTSVMLPYPSGVWVDPHGHLKRSDSKVFDDQPLNELLKKRGATPGPDKPADNHNAWQRSSPLRMVSLKSVDHALNLAATQPTHRIAPELIRLAGLTQVQFVLLAPDKQDIILAGIADGTQMGFFLEDLAVVCSLVNKRTSAFGCSIEPQQAELMAAQAFISTPQAGKLLARSPKLFANRLEQLVTTHEAIIFGMSAKSGTAVALLAADEQMKRVGFGKATLPFGIRTYFDFVNREATVSKQSIVRWWFDYADSPILANQSQTIFRLPNNCVRLCSEQQFLTEHGREPSGQHDLAADGFASEFTKRWPELRQVDASFSRLGCVFETALALQVALEATQLTDFRDWFPTLCTMGSIDHPTAREPKHVSGLTATHSSKVTRTNFAVVSGGVQIQPRDRATRTNWQLGEWMSGSAMPRTTQPSAGRRWWWD